MLNNKHNSKSGKRKIRKRDFKEKTRQETKKREHIHLKPRNCNFIFSCCSIHERKNNEKRDKNKKQKESQRRKTIRKKERQEQKRDRERETEKGAAKKG